jgi:NAD(P)-dependent dehydrogenase (short-subunit alcohol dehydrogenase family)
VLANHTALITGAGRGIGRATALRLAREGCNVALVARTAAEVEAVAAEIEPSSARAFVAVADITDDAQLESLVQRVLKDLGCVTILVNGAGVAPPRTPVVKGTMMDWDCVLATCLRAPIVLTRLLLPHMLARKSGTIINIASVAARAPRAGEAVYAAAKAGLVAFTQALFAEVRDSGIKAVAVCPSYVDTNFVPRNRRVDRSKFLRPEDVAETIAAVLAAPPNACATEVIVQPQFDPERF